MLKGTLAVSLLGDLAAFLDAKGVPLRRLLEAAGLPSDSLDDPDARIPFDAMQRAWEAAESLTGDPDVGLHCAEHPRTGALGLLGYVLLTSPTVGDALDAASRWFTVLNSGLRFTAATADDAVTLQLALRKSDGPLPRHIAETILLGTVRYVDLLAARPVVPVSVSFAHDAPASGAREHLRCFGVPVRFGTASNAVTYPASIRALAIRSHQPSVRDALAAQAERLRATIDGEDDVVGRVRQAIAAGLRGRAPAIAEVGRAMAMSPRSIQRALQQAGTSFQDLLDDVRREVALRTLATPGTTASEVGALLGFAEPASFTRAFRRWTGEAPSQFLRRAQPARTLTGKPTTSA
jgi:AraC-like DNA-binding protein